MKLGAEPKKVAALILLLIVAAVLFYQQFVSAPSTPAAAPPAKSPPAARQLRARVDDILENRTEARPRASQRGAGEFRPSLKKSKPGEGPDPVQLDPTLRTDLLAKIQAVDYEGVERNLFQFGARRPRIVPKAEEDPKPTAEAPKTEETPNAKPSEPPKPTAPPINMKYFGYVNRPGDARKRAFLIDGEEIYVAVEGDLIKKRYRVVRIGINSLVMEDVEFKSQQTLPLQEESG